MKKCQLLCLLLSVLLLLPAVLLPTNAETEGDFVYRVSSGEAVLLRYQGNDKVVEVPASLGGSPVVKIAAEAFKDSAVEEVILPEGITDINYSTFENCASLKKITLPEGLREIGFHAFKDCTSLRRINLPEGLVEIGWGAFLCCSALENVAFPSTLTDIDSNAFEKCTSLTEVVLPEGLAHLGQEVFLDCTALRKAVLPSTLKIYNPAAFQNCTALEEVVLPEGIEKIHASWFENCTSLKEINLPSTLTGIGYRAFRGCTALTRLEIPDSVTMVGFGFLAGCNRVELIPGKGFPWVYENGAYYDQNGFLMYAPNVTELPPVKGGIEHMAFADNDTLKTANIPVGVTAVKESAFENCTSLEEAFVPWTVEWLSGTFQGCKNLSKVTLHEGLKTIYSDTFAGCEALTEIRLPEGLTAIHGFAFKGTGISTVYIPASVTDMQYGVFADCPNLIRIECGASEKPENWSDKWAPEGVEIVWGVSREADPVLDHQKEKNYTYRIHEGEAILINYTGNATSLTLPSTLGGAPLTEIWKEAFVVSPENRENDIIHRIKIPEGVKKIGEKAFYYRRTLKTVVLPDSLETIGSEAFWGCGLVKLELPASVSVLPYGCFMYCPLEELVIPEGVVEIQELAFSRCGLMTISLPASVTDIHPKAFHGLPCLATIKISPDNPVYHAVGAALLAGDTLVTANGSLQIPGSVRVIGPYAFAEWGVESVKLPAGLERIEDYAFYCCSLQSVEIPEGVTYIGDFAFSVNRSLETVILPESLTYIGNYAFAETALEYLYVPKGVTYIAPYAFCANKSLKEIHFGATELQDGWLEYLMDGASNLESENILLGVENPYASEDPEEDVSGETSAESSEEISAEASEETSTSVPTPPAGTKSFPWILVGCAVGALGIAVVTILLRKKKQ